MFESFVSIVLPIVKDFVWAAAAALLAYALNKLQAKFA
jgi:hypothetical protein